MKSSVKKKSFLKESKFKKRNTLKSNKKPKKKVDFKNKKPPKHNSKLECQLSDEAEENEAASSAASDMEEDYEKKPRNQKRVKVRNLLPVKNKDGLKYRSEIVNDSDEDEVPETTIKERPKSLIESYAIQQKCLNDLKRKVALICTSIIEDPNQNMAALKELITMLHNPSTKMIISEKKILCLSLLHVFSDILPGYKIRLQEEKDPKVKLKKETKKLLGYEQTLLKAYKKYVDLLYDQIRDMKTTQFSSTASLNVKKAAIEIGMVALKCMCELLSTRFSFNYFKDLVNKLVPLAIDGVEVVSDMCCQAFCRMFKADKLGEASFSLVKQIVNVVKERKFRIPPTLLRTFLCLNLREAKPDIEKIDMKKGRKQWQQMSRTQRRDKKKVKELEAELKETQAYESVENVRKFHTATLNKVFWVFFHILKDGDKMNLIAPALEALSKFAHLINLEFFGDLNAVLCGMMESGKLSNVEKLHGVYTLFTILAGQAESLHIDPHRIYCHMYQGLWNLSHSTDIEHFELTLKCLEFNILRKKKKISPNRILAFIKRICTVSLQTPVHGTLGLLSAIRNLLLNVKGSDILLDSESSVGSGLYLPEVEDPEHCNPQSTALWELHLMRKHYNPAVKLYSQHVLSGCQTQGRVSLPDKLIKSSPEEVLHLYAEISVENKLDYLEENETPPRKKFKASDNILNLSYEKNINLEINPDVLRDTQILCL